MTPLPAARRLDRFNTLVLDRAGCRTLVTSRSVVEELFSLLEFYSEIHDSGRQFIKKRSGCSLSTATAVHPKFQAFIRQAKTFFIPAETLHHRARPLFYYYSFLNLAKALLCVCRPERFQGPDKFTHGLRERHKGGVFSDEAVLVTRDGVFRELYEISTSSAISGGTALIVEDMLRYIRDIDYDPETGKSVAIFVTGKSCRIFDKDQKTVWPLLALYDFEGLKKGAPGALVELMDYFEEVSVDWRSQERVFGIMATASPKWTFLQSKRVYSCDSKGSAEFASEIQPLCRKYFRPSVYSEEIAFVLSPPLGPSYRYPWNEFLAAYVTYFYLGSLVRYHPAYLESLLSSRAAWTLETFTQSAAETLLRHFVSLITGETIILSRR